MKNLILVFLLIVSFTASSQFATVKYVRDGDTYRIQIKDIAMVCRLAGVDCPEVKNRFTKKPDQKYGKKVKGLVNNLILNQKVKVKYINLDKYRRQVFEVLFPLNGRYKNLSNYLLEKGWAWAYYTGDSTSYKARLKKQIKAQEEKIGIWQSNDNIRPSEFREN